MNPYHNFDDALEFAQDRANRTRQTVTILEWSAYKRYTFHFFLTPKQQGEYSHKGWIVRETLDPQGSE
jgi:hypothetical protein|tara:strand:- start:2 stop:205 length:204 start_codon:yes stop_codon:yes gene_type:complete